MDILKTTKKAGGRPRLHFARKFATLFPQSHHSEGASGVLERRTRDLRTGDGLFGFVWKYGTPKSAAESSCSQKYGNVESFLAFQFILAVFISRNLKNTLR